MAAVPIAANGGCRLDWNVSKEKLLPNPEDRRAGTVLIRHRKIHEAILRKIILVPASMILVLMIDPFAEDTVAGDRPPHTPFIVVDDEDRER